MTYLSYKKAIGSAHKAFTLIELLVVIAIIGILSTLVIVSLNNSRAGARDAKRLNDLKAIANALELYYADNNEYPSSLTPGEPLEANDIVYMGSVPSNPTPHTDGNCPDSDYSYSISVNGASYAIGFCLGANSSNTMSGAHTISSDKGIGSNDIVRWWKFNEGSGSVVLDEAGNSNGTRHGTLPYYAEGKMGTAANFAAGDTYISFSPATPTGSKTITAWVYQQDVICPTQSILGNYLMQLNSRRLSHYNGSTYLTATVGSALTLQTWNFVALVFNQTENTVSFYINGVFDSSQNNPDFNRVSQRIGAHGNSGSGCPGFPFSGYIDDLRIYNRALPGHEIKALYDFTN